MKKTLIAVAIVCAAVVSQGSTVKWFAMNVKDITGAANYSGAATLFAYDGTTQIASFDGTMANGMIQSNVASDLLVVGNSYTFQYTMTDTAGNVFTSNSYGPVQAQATSTPTLMFNNGGSWSAAPVPEPTSELLLLLGVAGLALRRKRA